MPAPEVIVLREYAEQPKRRVAFSRQNLCRRDGFGCQYCGRQLGLQGLTIDHVLPRSRGGGTTWENCVASCSECNHRKADRTPREAGMRLRNQPQPPRWKPTISVPREHFRSSWESFVGKSAIQLELC